MERFTFKLILITFCSLILWSCKKDAAGPSVNSTSKQEEDYQFYTRISDVFNATETDTNSHGRIAACGTSSWTSGTGNPVPLFGDQYIKYEISYNGTACTDGKKRNGKISWFWEKAWIWGNKDSLVYDHYSSDTVSANGYGRYIFDPTTSTGNKHHEADITFVGEDTYHWSGTYFYNIINKSTPSQITEINGSGTIVNLKTGYIIHWNIVSALTFYQSCNINFPLKGRIEFSNSRTPGIKTSLDYGDGTCDNKVIYTNPMGQTVVLTKK